jgi:hypothetical protein
VVFYLKRLQIDVREDIGEWHWTLQLLSIFVHDLETVLWTTSLRKLKRLEVMDADRLELRTSTVKHCVCSIIFATPNRFKHKITSPISREAF